MLSLVVLTRIQHEITVEMGQQSVLSWFWRCRWVLAVETFTVLLHIMWSHWHCLSLCLFTGFQLQTCMIFVCFCKYCEVRITNIFKIVWYSYYCCTVYVCMLRLFWIWKNVVCFDQCLINFIKRKHSTIFPERTREGHGQLELRWTLELCQMQHWENFWEIG